MEEVTMMDITVFENELESIHINGINDRMYSKSVTEMAESVVGELTSYEDFIPNFFYENGNESSIRQMYQNLHEEKFQESSIDIIDLYESKRIYTEYHDGMSNFVKEIISLNDGVAKESSEEIYRTNLEKAKNADDGFVSSLFGGKYNEPANVVMTEAVKNIEFLIDFIPEIDTLKQESNALAENCNDSELVKESISLLFESVCNYCYESIKTTMHTYKAINDVMNEIPKNKESKNSFKIW